MRGKKFISWKWFLANLNPNPNPKLWPRVRVGVNYWENDKRWQSQTKWKRRVSWKPSRKKTLKLATVKNFISWKWPLANPNPNPSPKLSPMVRVGVNSWEKDKRWESQTKSKRWVSSKTFREKTLKLVRVKKFISWKWPLANPNPNPKLSPRVRVRVTSWENNKRWNS